jgi:hypothetical protein
MPRAARWCGARRVTSAPSKAMSPRATGSTPITHLSNVVLPTPLRPKSARHSPWRTDSDTPRSVWLPP